MECFSSHVVQLFQQKKNNEINITGRTFLPCPSLIWALKSLQVHTAMLATTPSQYDRCNQMSTPTVNTTEKIWTAKFLLPSSLLYVSLVG